MRPVPEPPASIDVSEVGRLAAETMESVERQFGGDAEIGAVAMVVEVRHPDEEGDEATTITCCSNDRRSWVQYGLLRFAAQLVGSTAQGPAEGTG
jgi:hypothetical protein